MDKHYDILFGDRLSNPIFFDVKNDTLYLEGYKALEGFFKLDEQDTETFSTSIQSVLNVAVALPYAGPCSGCGKFSELEINILRDTIGCFSNMRHLVFVTPSPMVPARGDFEWFWRIFFGRVWQRRGRRRSSNLNIEILDYLKVLVMDEAEFGRFQIGQGLDDGDGMDIDT